MCKRVTLCFIDWIQLRLEINHQHLLGVMFKNCICRLNVLTK